MGGAIYIGWRQIGISKAQAKQLETSADREFALRQQIEFFGPRSIFFEEFRTIWGLWTQHSDLNDEELRTLKILFHRAQLLYPEEIANNIGEAWYQLSEKRRYAVRSQGYSESGDDEAAKRDQQKSYCAEDAASELLQPLFQKIKDASRIHTP